MRQKIHFVLWRSMHEVSGVTTSALRLRRALCERGIDSKILLAWPHPNPAGHLGADYLIRSWKAYRRFLAEEGPVTLVLLAQKGFTQLLLETYRAKLAGLPVKILGDYQSDHEGEYYRSVPFFETMADGFLCVSHTVRDQVRKRVQRGISVDYVPRGVDIAPAVRPLSPQPLRLVYTGRIVQKQKRIFDFVEFVQELERGGRPYTLTFVGDGADRRALQRKLEGTTKGVLHWEGSVSVARVLEICSQSHALVNLSEYEGLSQSMVEAMGQGCFPAVTQVSGVDQVVRAGHNGLSVPVGAPRDLARQLGLLSDAQLVEFRQHAWGWARDRFSVGSSANQLLEVIEGLSPSPLSLTGAQVTQLVWRHRLERQVKRLHWRKIDRYLKDWSGVLTRSEPDGTLREKVSHTGSGGIK